MTKFSFALPIGLLKLKVVPDFLLNFLCFNNQAEPETFHSLSKSLQTVSTKVLRSRIKNMSHLSSEVQKIDLPCTYIQPSNDYLISKQAIEHLKNCCININIITLTGGHFIAQSNVNGCTKVIGSVVMQN